VSARLKELAALNRELGIHGGFHNHSNNTFGASLWDVHHVLADTDPKALGLYFDPAHATIEGGAKGWLMGMDLLADRITMLAVKDFRWVNGHHRHVVGRGQSIELCPLAEGNTDWPEVLTHLKQIGFDGPVSFHGEYQGPHSFADLTSEQVLEQTARDVDCFRGWMSR
jgi:sugar phosphate isomerase/epimerase